MDRRVALGLALATGALAITLVSLDLAWNLTTTLEGQQEGQWVTVARAGGDGFYDDRFYGRGGCTSPELRLTVENDQPWKSTVDVWAWYWPPGGQAQETIVRETWHLSAFSSQEREFTVPREAYAPPPDQENPFFSGSITVMVNDLYLSACVQEAV